ncbi:MAG: Fur family transcriptional regulator [Pseudanabaena sp. ELA607]|jgi:Fur family ferric uptake transcriptional regulator
MTNAPPATAAINGLISALNQCQKKGMRVSRQRRYILELLWQSGEHLSARAIYDRLTQNGKPIGHTSVYQNLEALANQGIIECLERGEGRLYGSISTPHSHVHCPKTGVIMDVHIKLPPEIIAYVESHTGTKIDSYRIEFIGQKVDS